MENDNHATKEAYFFIAIAGIFMLVICHSWLSDGMFLDGTIYAVFSRNLANGLGTFWQPHLTNTLFPAFFEHPPLAFGLESLFFRIFGDSRFVERFYSLLTIFVTGILIVSIWKQILKKSKTGWLPLFFWITMPTVNWTSVNNMLENTLGIFICLSVLFYLKSQKSNRMVFLFLTGLMISLGFLTKGFVSFTPLSFPFFLWLFSGNRKFFSMILDTIIILGSTILPLILLFLFTGAHEFFPRYIQIVFSKISTGETTDSRFYIIYRLVMELLPAIGISLLLILFSLKSKFFFSKINVNIRAAASFFCFGLAGVLPIMLSMDQSAYFLILSFPFFAVSLALIFDPIIELLLNKVDVNSNAYWVFKKFGILALLSGIVLSVYFSGAFSRDKNTLTDMRAILLELKEGSTINILPGMYEEWNLHAYYARYGNVSLDTTRSNKHDYLLIRAALISDSISKEFDKVDLKTKEYELFRRKVCSVNK